MDSPANDIEGVIKTLCMGSAHEQDEALNKYFLPDAEFIHPLCWVPRFRNVAVPFFGSIDSLWLVQCIYRWYITFAPKLDIVVDSTAFDEKNSLLYATARQSFTIWFFPIYSVTVKLVTVLKLEKQHSRLVHDGNTSPELEADGDSTNGASMLKYYIASQEDMYQMNYCLEFLGPHVAARLWTLVQLFTTFVCMILSVLTLPLHFYMNPDTKRQKVKQ
ncbi:uncharacterized protein LMH87_008317 [Akanthomyces muscarius]|uniref:SigF-like NTF2-like domain-containing protein n=2 Tax=Akanthomyces TaxID=150366 RepID=A0A168CU86_CORDF|nr:uncharacterized protein LMH87_008317 [Akanthomyces muscarius]KAJ4159415.1 hypothetical protein LMH87_008317 [Akanthomyces muscarius]OAA71798.1 hypothetical protein LEL_09033 [Akanthomyces lecanii RCEF 1005]